MFGLNNQLVVSYREESMIALKNLFIKDYSGEDEDDYSAAVYSQQDVYDSLFYVVEQVLTWHTPFSCNVKKKKKMRRNGCNLHVDSVVCAIVKNAVP